MQEFLTSMSAVEIATATMAATTALLTGMLLRQHKQIRSTAQEMAQLREKLDLFADTSINVARCVDKLVNVPVVDAKHKGSAQQASRRWILKEAKTRMDQGNSLSDIATPLGLSRDEVRLLDVIASRQPDSLQHRH